MKKLIILAFVSGLLFTSCTKRYTCPTYLKNDDLKKEAEVNNEQPTFESAEKEG